MATPLATAFVLIRPDGTGFGTTLRRQLSEAGKVAAAEGGKAGDGWVKGFQKSKIAHVANLMSEALVGAGAVSVDMAAKFDAAMERIHTQAGAAQSQIGSLSKGVLQLAGQVGFSPESLAESLYHVESNFASLGIKGPKAIALVKVAAQGAAVGGADLVDVTNALTAAVASGIPGVKNMGQAMGVLNAIVGAGDMQMQDLAEAFGSGMVATVKGFGLSLADVGAALDVFGDNNIRGAHAGNQLRMSVMALAAPTKAGAQSLVAMGISSGSLARAMQQHGLLFALDELMSKMRASGITAKTQGEFITNAFGKKAGAGLNVLLDQMDRLRSKYPAMEKGARGFGSAWAATQRTAAQQMKELRAGFEAVAVEVGNRLLPPVMKALNFIRDHMSGVLRFGAVLGGLALAISAVSFGLKAYAVAAGIYSAVTKGVTLATTLFTAAAVDGRIALIAMSVGAEIAAGASKVAAAAQWLWNIAMDANPVGIIVVAIGALVAGVIYAYTHFKWFRDFVQAVWRDMKAWTVDAWHVIYDVFKVVFTWIEDHWKLLLVILTGPIGLAIDIIVTQWKHVEAAFKVFWRYVWTDFGAKIMGFFVHTLPGWLMAAAKWVDKNLVQPWIAYQKLLWRYLWTDFGAKIMGFFIRTIPGWLRTAYNWLVANYIDPWKQAFGDLYQWIWTDFGAKIGSFLIRTIPGWFSDAVRAIGTAWHDIESAVKIPVNWVIQYVYDDGIRKIWNFVSNIAGLNSSLPFVKPLAAGGRIPGFGGGDRWPALLEGGEAVIDKNRTKALAPLFSAIGVPGFAKGGVAGDKGMTGTPQASFLGSLLGGIFGPAKIMAALATGNKVALANALDAMLPGGTGGARAGSGIAQLIASLPAVIIMDLAGKAIRAFAAGGGAIAHYAESFIGKVPYVWGGTSLTSGVDCSGFTQRIYEKFGYSPPRTAAEQQAWAQKTGSPVPGGLAFFAGANGTARSAGHVGIITGPNQMVDAFGTGFGVMLNSLFGSSGSVGGFGIPPGGFGHHGVPVSIHDRGGWLPPGLSLSYNGTGRHERVLGPGDDLAGLLGAVCDRLDALIAIGASAPGEHAAALGGAIGGSVRRGAYRAMYSPR